MTDIKQILTDGRGEILEIIVLQNQKLDQLEERIKEQGRLFDLLFEAQPKTWKHFTSHSLTSVHFLSVINSNLLLLISFA